jgi:hypothetical protein
MDARWDSVPDIAIGLLNTDVSVHRQADDQLIAAIAHERGYRLAQVLEVSSATYMAVALVVHTAVCAGAVAVVAPDVEHFGSASARQAVVRAVALETKDGKIPRSTSPSSTRPTGD